MKRVLFMVMAVALNFSMSSCASAGGFSNEKIRYKMTVTVETPEGVKTGYAVREASRYTEPSILPDQGGTMYNITKGEAVVVDLGQRGVLFVLLGRGDEARTVFKSFSSDRGKYSDAVVLTLPQYPKLIYFKDKNNPVTAEAVLETSPCADPATGIPHSSVCLVKERFAEFFGDGVSLKSISVEQTDETVTDQIEEWLPWIPEYYNQMLDGQRYNTIRSEYPLANKMSAGSFKIKAE